MVVREEQGKMLCIFMYIANLQHQQPDKPNQVLDFF